MASSPVEAIKRLREHLLDAIAGQEEAIQAVLAALASGEPCLLVGPPGTTKSTLIEIMVSMTDMQCFYFPLHEHVTPEELIGPLDIAALIHEKKFTRITKHMLPEADVIFLDEIDKCRAIRPLLLDIVLHKRIVVAGELKKLPTVAIYFAANEPLLDPRDAAFYDRMTLRVFLDYLSDEYFEELIAKAVKIEVARIRGKPLGTGKVVLTKNQVRQLHLMVADLMEKFPRNKNLMQAYKRAVMELRKAGIVISDRKKGKIVKVAAALAVISGGDRILEEDLADAILFCVPREPDEVPKVKDIITNQVGLVDRNQLRDEVNKVIKEIESIVKSPSVKDMTRIDQLVSKGEILLRKRPPNQVQLSRAIMEAKNIRKQLEKKMWVE